ncbi:MAG: hypothetical protein V3R25_07270 [Nitrosomonadaceae bacterium]
MIIRKTHLAHCVSLVISGIEHRFSTLYASHLHAPMICAVEITENNITIEECVSHKLRHRGTVRILVVIDRHLDKNTNTHNIKTL